MSINDFDNLLEFINNELKLKEKEKIENGEVFTPLWLVNEMLDKLDETYMEKYNRSIFSEVNFKWLDPAVGIGNFLIMVYQRLMKELIIFNEEDRKKHILENMLYACEINPANVNMYKKIFCCDKYKLNIYEGDTLKMNLKKEYNVVLGNPPYNARGHVNKGNTIWQRFTSDAINEWSTNFLLFVHPPGWRKPSTKSGRYVKLFELMTKQNQMLYLEIHGLKDGKKTFDCGTRYDWYIIEKTSQYKNTVIIDEYQNQYEINLSKLSWLPNSSILEVNKLLATNGDNCPLLHSESIYDTRHKCMSLTQTDEFKYPCVHSIPKKGVRFMYSKVNDKGHFGVSKVIFGCGGINETIIDMEGRYGMTQYAMAIQVDNLEEATDIKKALESDKFKKIIKSCLYSLFFIDWKIFKEFKKDFYKEFI